MGSINRNFYHPNLIYVLFFRYIAYLFFVLNIAGIWLTCLCLLAVERPLPWKGLNREEKNTRIWTTIKAPQTVRKEMPFSLLQKPPSWILKGIMMTSDSLIPLFSSGYLRITTLDEEREGRYFFAETQEVQKKILTHQLLEYIEVIHLSSLLEESDILEWLIMNSFTESAHSLFISKQKDFALNLWIQL